MRRLSSLVRCVLLLASASLAATCGLKTSQGPQASSGPRSTLILVSIDGWRWDYLNRFAPPALSALASRGVRSEGLIPSFPSKTFPNHYTIVTGLYPDHHGIVSNTMRDPLLPGLFSLSNFEVQQDTRWWGGTPLWTTAERQGRIAATMFWPGSDIEIAGDRPTHWRKFDENISSNDRVDQILEWLQRPEAQRPTFYTLYFDEIDSAGHDFGPDAPEMRAAVAHLDAAVARLSHGLEALRVTPRTNLVVLSDHGMAQNALDRVIFLEDYVSLAAIDVIEWSPILGVTPRVGSVDDLYRALRDKHPAMKVFKSEDLPARYRLAGHRRYPPLIGVADDGWEITSRERLARDKNGLGGNHGYDPMNPSMHGLFLATGPAFRDGLKVPRFENVHVYELLCRALGIRPEPNDGDRRVTAAFFR